MLLQSLGEVVLSILAKGVIVIVGGVGLQRRFNGRKTGIGNGRGRQAGVLLEIVLGVRLLVGVGNRTLMVRQGIQ